MASTPSRWFLRGLQGLALALCALSLGPGALPASAGGGPSVSLEAGTINEPPGFGDLLVARASSDVRGTGNVIGIYNVASGRLLKACRTGTTCSYRAIERHPAFRRFQAFLAPYSPRLPTGKGTVSSNEVDVSWSTIFISLSLDPTTPTLIAVAAQNLGTTAFYIEVFDVTTGQLLGFCGAGPTCPVAFTPNGNPQTYQAYIMRYSPNLPTSFQGVSNYVITGGKG